VSSPSLGSSPEEDSSLAESAGRGTGRRAGEDTPSSTPPAEDASIPEAPAEEASAPAEEPKAEESS